MKKNNKGFTMIEIISVVIIMGVILLLIIPGISKLMAQFRKDYYDKLEGTINESGKEFYSDNKIYLPDGILESSYVNVSSLISEKYVDSLLDYRGNDCELGDKKSYTIVVHRGDGKYEYKTCIDCSKEGYVTNKKGTYCDPAWLNGSLGYDYGGTADIYFYYGTAREKIREDLIKRLNVVRYDNAGNVIDRVAIGDTKEDEILPTNIDIIDNKPILDSSNKKEYLMTYGSDVDNNKEELYAVIYKHKAPQVTMTSGGTTYTSGNWTNDDVIITLKKNDEFFQLAGVGVLKYQWSKDGGSTWEDIACEMNSSEGTCTIALKENQNTNYRFRLINTDSNISDETIDYNIKIDKVVPILNLDYSIGEQDTNLYINKITYGTKDEYGCIEKIEYIEKTTNTQPTSSNSSNIINISGSTCVVTSSKTYTNLITQSLNYNNTTTDKYLFIRTVDKAGNKSEWQSINLYIGNKLSIPSYDTVNAGKIGSDYSLDIYKCNGSTCSTTSRKISEKQFNLSDYGDGFYKFNIIANNNVIVSRITYFKNYSKTLGYSNDYESSSITIDNKFSTVKNKLKDPNVSSFSASIKNSKLELSFYAYPYDSYVEESTTCSCPYGTLEGDMCTGEDYTFEGGNTYTCEYYEPWDSNQWIEDFGDGPCGEHYAKEYICEGASLTEGCTIGDTYFEPCTGYCTWEGDFEATCETTIEYSEYYYKNTVGVVIE